MTLLQYTGALIVSIKLYVGSEMGWWDARGGGEWGEFEDPQPHLQKKWGMITLAHFQMCMIGIYFNMPLS